jgi:hypothetical protein
MARPEENIPTSLDEALVELKRDPATAVRVRVEGMDVELRVVSQSSPAEMGLGDWIASAGPWQGESEDEILEVLREARRAGGSSESPEMPTTKASDDVLDGATWHGESAAELIQIIRDGRELDDPAEERSDRVESPNKIL